MGGNKEDYLKAIYELGGNENQVSNKDIANFLDISAPSVSEMLKKLQEQGYIEYIMYQGVKLTNLGVKEYSKVKRRHLLWEVFLVEKLGFSWDEVHEEAEVLEHVTSPKLEERLEKYLNYPKVCPHGNPILKYEQLKTIFRSLDSLKINEKGVIRRFEDKRELLNYVKNNNLLIGDKIEIVDKDTDYTSILIGRNHEKIKINNDFIKKIYIE